MREEVIHGYLFLCRAVGRIYVKNGFSLLLRSCKVPLFLTEEKIGLDRREVPYYFT